MIQDVVYNHLGPSGNYLPEFFPVFAEGGANTWVTSVNLSGQEREIDLDVAAADVLFSTGELPAVEGRTVTPSAESAAVVSTR